MIPQITNSMELTQVELPSKTYKLNEDTNKIIGFVDNLEAMKQLVYHILSVERYSCLIYDDNYGVELEQYLGKSFEYVKTTIEDTLSEALTHDLRINSVSVTKVEKVNLDKVSVEFTVDTIYGNILLEVNVNV